MGYLKPAVFPKQVTQVWYSQQKKEWAYMQPQQPAPVVTMVTMAVAAGARAAAAAPLFLFI